MRISLGSCQIRDYTLADVSSLAQAADNPRIASTLRDRFPSPYTRADARAFIERTLAQIRPTSFAIADDAGVIGGIGIEIQSDVHYRSAELGFWLAEEHCGRGIATSAVRAFTDHCFSSFDLIRIQAFVFENNPASARVLEKCGFTLEGRLRRSVVKNGLVLDQLLYARVVEGDGV